jgi:hypothetical protein
MLFEALRPSSWRQHPSDEAVQQAIAAQWPPIASQSSVQQIRSKQMRKLYDDDDRNPFDRNGLLKNGRSFRVRTTMMDAMPRDLREHSRRPLITDDAGRGGLALNRPGFRVMLDDAAGAHAKEVAYRRADAEMVEAWRNLPTDAANSRVCPECDGSGLDENSEDDCPFCGGTGVVDDDYESKADDVASRRGNDSRSVNQIVRDHQANMARIYADHDCKLSESWRRA